MGVRELMVKPATAIATNFTIPLPWSPALKRNHIRKVSIDDFNNAELEYANICESETKECGDT